MDKRMQVPQVIILDWIFYSIGSRYALSISPTHHITSGVPPMIECHGDKDTVSPYQSIHDFKTKMTAAGNEFVLHVLPGEGHEGMNANQANDAADQIYDFLKARGLM